ncbi:MAG: hypothetical protein WA705_21910 [Candidatus Ozemobacteraceae bacterium]
MSFIAIEATSSSVGRFLNVTMISSRISRLPSLSGLLTTLPSSSGAYEESTSFPEAITVNNTGSETPTPYSLSMTLGYRHTHN